MKAAWLPSTRAWRFFNVFPLLAKECKAVFKKSAYISLWLVPRPKVGSLSLAHSSLLGKRQEVTRASDSCCPCRGRWQSGLGRAAEGGAEDEEGMRGWLY